MNISDNNKIAIIGTSFEFPGVKDLNTFWEGLLCGKLFYHLAESEEQNKVNAWGGPENIEMFDYQFFGFSYKEACHMDPQHRLLLQHSWWAMENAGYMNKKDMPIVAIYASASENHYLWNNLSNDIQQGVENESLIGNLPDFLATKIAYRLGTKGQALTIQCGCSSGLAGIHSARVALLTGQADVALVGAVSLSAPNHEGYYYIPEGIRSKDGRIYTFDERASGTVFTNGVAVLVLKPLNKALLDGDNVLGIIVGSALNNDGSDKASFTAPSSNAQCRVIQKALRVAKIDASKIAFIETHGTGTKLGDPIEVSGIRDALAFNKLTQNSCALQSVKANIGHLDTVSGIAGLLKACLVLEHNILPPQINFETLNPFIDIKDSGFFINVEPQVFSKDKEYGCVSAMGFGGTNAHVIVCHAEKKFSDPLIKTSGLYLISATNPISFQNIVKEYSALNISDAQIEKGAKITQTGRTEFKLRKSIWIESSESFQKNFVPNLHPVKQQDSLPKIVWMFTGQGSQYSGMGTYLYSNSDFFKEKLDEKLLILRSLTGIDYHDILFNSETRIHEPQHTQPSLLAFESTLGEYLNYCGIKPNLLIGHSLGEYSALVISKAIDFKDAASLIIERANLIRSTQPGGMCSILASKQETVELLSKVGIHLDIAALNAPQLTTLSGSTKDINTFIAYANDRNLFCQPLRVERAFHSYLLEPILEQYRIALRKVQFHPPLIPIVSTMDCEVLSLEKISNPDYWLGQMRQPVNFVQAINKTYEMNARCFIEIGPGQTLKTLSQRIMDGKSTTILNTCPSQRELNKEKEVLYTFFGKMWEIGFGVKWKRIENNSTSTTTPVLPLYSFDLTNCWINEIKKISHKSELKDYHQYWRQLPPIAYEPQKSDEKYLAIYDNFAKQNQIIADLKKEYNIHMTLDFSGSIEQHWNESKKKIISGLQEKPFGIILFIEEDKQNPSYNSLLKILNIIQSIQEVRFSSIRKLLIVSSNSVDLMNDINPSHAILTTAVKTLNQEYSAIVSRLIDYDGKSIHTLINELSLEQTVPVVTLKGRERFCEAYEVCQTDLQVNEKFDINSIIILGGSGHIGLQYAQVFLENTSASIYLLQRSDLDSLINSNNKIRQEKGQLVERICQKYSNRIFIRKADITNIDDLRRCCVEIQSIHNNIDLIIHAAGVDASMHYQLINKLTPEFCRDSFSAKTIGLNNMALIAKEFGISHCHVVSSISGLLGGMGMFVYGSLHAWLDAQISYYEKKHPSKWSSINWEAWEFNNDIEIPEEFRQGSFGAQLNTYAMRPVNARNFLWKKWDYLIGKHIFSNVDFQTRYEEWVETNLIEKELTIESEDVKAPRPSLSVEYKVPTNKIERRLEEIWSHLLGIKNIGIDDNFFELGGHSLLALRMTGNINKIFNCNVSLVDIFKYPTIQKIAYYIQGKQNSESAIIFTAERAEKRKKAIKMRERIKNINKLN